MKTTTLLKKLAEKGIACLFFSICIAYGVQAQTCSQGSAVLVGGTHFEARYGEEYRMIGSTLMIGPSGGVLSTPLPFAENFADFGVRNAYGIVDNPSMVNPNFIDINQSMILLSSTAGANSTMLTFDVSGLKPASQYVVIVEGYLMRATNTCDPPGPNLQLAVNIGTNGFPDGQNGGWSQSTSISSSKWQNKFTLTSGTRTLATGATGFTFHIMKPNDSSYGNCVVLGISKIEIRGCLNPKVMSSEGTEVCKGEQIRLRLDREYDANDYQWEKSSNGTNWNAFGGNTKSVLDDEVIDATWYRCTVDGTLSEVLRVNTIVCCEIKPGVPASRKTIYHENFGRFSSPRDYVNMKGEPYRTLADWKTDLPYTIPNHTVNAAGPPPDGSYIVSVLRDNVLLWLGGGALREDASGDPNGGVLMINIDNRIPSTALPLAIYSHTIDGLCPDVDLYFETSFADASGSGSLDLAIRIETTTGSLLGSARITGATLGSSRWNRITIPPFKTTENSVILKVSTMINGSNSGGDLLIDDIIFRICTPPIVEIYSDIVNLTQDATICNRYNVDLGTQVSNLVDNYYDNVPRFLFQASTNGTTWTNISGILNTPTYSHPLSGYPSGSNVYFRILVGTAGLLSDFVANPGFQDNTHCKTVSISDPIKIHIDCPCPTPNKVQIAADKPIDAKDRVILVCMEESVTLRVTPTVSAQCEVQWFESNTRPAPTATPAHTGTSYTVTITTDVTKTYFVKVRELGYPQGVECWRFDSVFVKPSPAPAVNEPMNVCLETGNPTAPTAAHSICFKFKSNYADGTLTTRPTLGKFIPYRSKTGSDRIGTDTIKVPAGETNPGAICYAGNLVQVEERLGIDTLYNIYLQDVTPVSGALGAGATQNGTNDTGLLGTSGTWYGMTINIYEPIIIESFTAFFRNTHNGQSRTPTITPVLYSISGTTATPILQGTPTSFTLNGGGTITSTLPFDANSIIQPGTYFLAITCDNVDNIVARYYNNYASNWDNTGNSILERVDFRSLNRTTLAIGAPIATGNAFFNIRFRTADTNCGRVKLTAKYFCPPCSRPDIQDGKPVEILSTGGRREGNTIYLCNDGGNVNLSVKQLKYDKGNPNTQFDILWYQADSEAAATSPLKPLVNAGTDIYTVTAWTNNTNEVQTRRYYVKVQDTDKKSSAECWVWDYVDIKVSPDPTLTNTPLTETVCSEDNRSGVVLTSNVTNAVTTYSWTTSVTGGITVNSSSGTGNLPGETLINNGDAPGTVTYRITPSVNECDGTPVNYTVTINPKAEITLTSPTATANQIICENNNITDITYSLTGGAKGATVAGLPAGVTYGVSSGTLTITGKPSVTGEYNYTVTTTGHDAPCAAVTANGKIVINSIPTVVPVGNKTFCADDNVSITFSSPATGATFEWQNNNTAIGLGASGNGNNISFKAINSTGAPVTGTITVTPTAGCVGTPETFTITVNPKPVITITNNPATSILTCTEPSITLTATGGGTYAWSGGLGNSAGITVTQAGTYTVTVTTNGCNDTKSVTITADRTPPVAGITYSETVLTCDRPTISLTATGGGTYAWNGGLGNNATVTVNAAGTYTVTVTAANGCTADKSVTITTDENRPTIVITPNPATTVLTCKTPSISLTATGGVTYTWSNGNSGATTTVTGAGNYTVTATAANGCTGTQSIEITIDQSNPTISVNHPEICLGGEATITASGADSYTWSTGETGATITVSPAATTNYTVEGTVEATSCKNTATATVYVETPIGLTLDAPKSVELGSELTITVTPERPDHGYFEWFINDQPYKTISEYTLTLYPDAGRQHFLVHTATTKLNCPSSSEIYVEVSESVPNIINPYNPNGSNCCFMKGYHVEIYNRYMQKVFEGNNGWDGTYRGAIADPGSYFYRLHKKGGQVEKGTLEVVKF